MSLDWEHVEQWEAGEIALLALIAALFLLLIVLLVCILHYYSIYRELKRLEPKALYSYAGDGPAYHTGMRAGYDGDSSDDDEDEPMSGVNNVNMANKEIRRSLGAGPLVRHHRRYNTNTGQSASTDSESSSDSNDDSGDTQSNLKANILHHDEEDEDDSVQKMYINPHRSGGHQYSATMQPPPHPQYSYIHPQHAASMQMYQGIDRRKCARNYITHCFSNGIIIICDFSFFRFYDRKCALSEPV